MFRIVCDPPSGSTELCLTEITLSVSQIFFLCLVGVWQRNFEPAVCVCVCVCVCACVRARARTVRRADCKNARWKTEINIILSVVSYGCDTWCPTLREEQRLRMLESRCWGRYLNLPGLRKLRSGGDCIMRSLMVSTNYQTFFEQIIRGGRDGLDTCQERYIQGNGGRNLRKRLHLKPRRRRKDNIKMEIQETEWGRWRNDLT